MLQGPFSLPGTTECTALPRSTIFVTHPRRYWLLQAARHPPGRPSQRIFLIELDASTQKKGDLSVPAPREVKGNTLRKREENVRARPLPRA